MENITPTLHLVVSDSGSNAEINNGRSTGALVREISNERIVLIVGQFQQRIPEAQPHIKYLSVDNVADAERVIAEIQRVYRKAPAAIIYRFNSGLVTGFPQWEEFFTIHQSLRLVPFFLFTEQISDNLRLLKKKQFYIDDIINRSSFENLAGKIDFVSKFKKMQSYSLKPSATEPLLYKRKWGSYLLKRSFDIIAATVLLLLASPAMLIIAALIKLESKGNILYASPRAGKNYKIFKFYKFRTMVADADKLLNNLKHLNQYDGDEKGAVFYKVSNDPRVTRLGGFLRNSSLDEIPQLFNVLKGDMSLVGNRPLPLYEAASLTTDEWAERFLAPAGITGLWQISKRGKKEMSAQERIKLDINYAHRNSFKYDLWLILNTPKALIQKDNV